MLTVKKSRIFQWTGIIITALFSLLYSQLDVSISGNESTRFAVIQAFGEQGVFHINHTEFRTVDRVIHDGKIYSDKPLPLAWSIGVVHKTVFHLTGLNFHDNYHLLIYCYNLLAGGLVNVLIFVWLFNQLRRYRKGSLREKFFIALAAVLGSWLLSYSVTVNNHTPAALALLGWFIVLEKFCRKQEFLTAVLSGLTAGIVTALDLPIGFFTCLVNIPVLWFAGKKSPVYTAAGIAGSALAAIFILGLNYYAYDTIIPLYISGGNGTFTPGTGEKNHLGYLIESLIGYRGLFSYQPFLLLAIPGVYSLRKKLSPPAVGAIAVCLISVIFYWVMTNEFGGAAYGFRYLIPLIPLLWYFAGTWLLAQKMRWIRFVAAILIFWGVITALAGAYAPFCLAFEGHRSPPRHITRTIRSSFTGNLLAWSYENAPDGKLTAILRNWYGKENSRRYLMSAYLMLKKIEPMAAIAQEK